MKLGTHVPDGETKVKVTTSKNRTKIRTIS
jgi:hypothetical protein